MTENVENRFKMADQKQETITKMAENAENLFKMAENGKKRLR